jgi:hypothetical protein
MEKINGNTSREMLHTLLLNSTISPIGMLNLLAHSCGSGILAAPTKSRSSLGYYLWTDSMSGIFSKGKNKSWKEIITIAQCAPWAGRKPHFTSFFHAPLVNNAGATSTSTGTLTWTSIQ